MAGERRPALLDGVVEKRFGAHANRRARRTGPHAGRPAGKIFAHVALDRFFCLILAGLVALKPGLVGDAEQQPRQQAGPSAFRIDGRHLNHAVRAVAFAIAAADAGAVDEYLAVGVAMNCIGRAFLHAMRRLAVPARGRHVNVGEGCAGLAVQSRCAVM